MALKDYKLFDQLENKNEELVIEVLNEKLEGKTDFCTCNQCLIDIVAVTLNDLQPNYETTYIGNFHQNEQTVEEKKSQINILMEKAIQKVKNRPHH